VKTTRQNISVHWILVTLIFFLQHEIVHRDIRLDNMYYEGTRLVLADFGNGSYLAQGSSLTGIAGTRAFSSPQMLDGLPYDHRTDNFSLGASLHKVITKILPYASSVLDITRYDRNEDDVMMNIVVSIKKYFHLNVLNNFLFWHKMENPKLVTVHISYVFEVISGDLISNIAAIFLLSEVV
jgi:serine/threonine protein kinase